ncbi:hypothetical protein EYUKI_298 [Bacillus phage Eyuki]|uniref:Uncharacterized protein n=1 Tax=Bacillus phage Eyuki TaxID=1690431 RepID=A0A0K2FLN3_9CAUD|nr:hypothetical protein QLX47_gp001 [Bacillus phage Eyuki]YP_009212238.1 hypothetical protein QLX47_gp298 [Bacillus phage Eyuki]ALA46559.1 hypothetical protein EYUKI_1 [Bacillus phage Eyuki]ALA46706.1 hypothetical protein EYUKI_298 [Bacillus phage Eyuki]
MLDRVDCILVHKYIRVLQTCTGVLRGLTLRCTSFYKLTSTNVLEQQKSPSRCVRGFSAIMWGLLVAHWNASATPSSSLEQSRKSLVAP